MNHASGRLRQLANEMQNGLQLVIDVASINIVEQLGDDAFVDTEDPSGSAVHADAIPDLVHAGNESRDQFPFRDAKWRWPRSSAS